MQPPPLNIGSGNGLVPSGTKPLPKPMLNKIYVTICITRLQWVDMTSSDITWNYLHTDNENIKHRSDFEYTQTLISDPQGWTMECVLWNLGDNWPCYCESWLWLPTSQFDDKRHFKHPETKSKDRSTFVSNHFVQSNVVTISSNSKTFQILPKLTTVTHCFFPESLSDNMVKVHEIGTKLSWIIFFTNKG